MGNSRVSRIVLAAMVRLYRMVLVAYPKEHRRAYGEDMAQLFGDQAREVREAEGVRGLLSLGLHTAWDLIATAFEERSRVAAIRASGALSRQLYKEPRGDGNVMLVVAAFFLVSNLIYAAGGSGLLAQAWGLTFGAMLLAFGLAERAYARRRRLAVALRAAGLCAGGLVIVQQIVLTYSKWGIAGLGAAMAAIVVVFVYVVRARRQSGLTPLERMLVRVGGGHLPRDK